jgi:subtilisin family serine protease/PKD repeat protein
MKKHILVLTFLIVSITTLFSQHIYENSQDGKLFFKIKDDVRVLMPVKNNNIDISEVNFLSGIIDAYQITSVEKAFDLKGGSKKLNRIYLMQFADHAQVDNIIRDLENINNVVEYAERVPLPKPFYTPDDPFYTSTEWGYNWNWYLDVINAEDAWDISTGDANINVAVVDNAIWADHPDLTNKVVAQYNAVTDTEGNSSPPTSVPQDDSETAYEWSHGTHCAGLVGAETDNNLGIASIGYNVSLMTARGAEDNGDLTHTAYGVQWAANNGADVISMSYGSSSYSSSMEQFFQDIKDAGIVLVAAAGNDGVSTDHYPAAYSSVIAVGASDADDQLSSFSQYGSWVDIAAPGGFSPSGDETNRISLTSTTYCEAYAAGSVPMFTGENYDIMQGTSMACPVAAGLVGLMVSLNPALTPDEVLSCLQTTADPLTGGNSISPDGGRINALEAMECVLSTLNVPPVADFSAVPTTLTVGNTVTFTESCTGTVDSMHWNFPGGSPSSATGSGPHDVQYDTVGQYDVSLTAYNAYGSDTETKNAYIDVVEVSTECDTLSNIHDDDTLTYYTTAEGYVSGHNEYDFEEFAEYFSASPAYNMTGIVIAVAKADALSADPKITLKVWDDDSGEPGNELYTEDVDISSLTAGSYNSLDFQNEVAVPAEFYVGYQIYYNSPQDTFAVYMAKDRGDSSPYSSTAYTTYNSAWQNLDDLFSGSGGLNTAYVIYPVFCPPAPTADFTADQYEGCDSLLVSFTDQSSSNTNSWYWDFDDGDTSSLQNPDHSFETPGTYHVTLIASNDGGSNSHTDTILVYASPSCDLGPDISLCADETPVPLDPGYDPDYDYQWTGGSTTPSLLVDTSGTYQVTVTNNMCSATDEINVTVQPLTEITQQPENNDMCMSEDHTLTIAAQGINLTYQWQKDGTDIPGATSGTYTINNADLADEGDYNCIVSGTCDTVSSDTVSLIIGTTTQITSQPSGTTICEGNNHTFSITATGSNLSYQWKKDGVDVGTDDPSLTINNIILADAGDYTCVASGDCGTETSDPASLVVTPLTQITDQPDNAVACQGEDHSFTVTASGDNLTYQWQKDGINISSATSDLYTISGIDIADEGNFNCIVEGTCGTAGSDTVALTVGETTQITSQPTGASLCEGYNHTFSVTATGSNLSYQWKKDGVDVGTDDPSLSINSATLANSGIYTCVVTGDCGVITSDTAMLTVTPETQITAQPDNMGVCEGDNHTFSVNTTGENLTYQWQKDNVDITNATSDTYTITGIDIGDEGTYHCIVEGTCGTASSDTVALTVGDATQITSQPSNTTVCEGDNHTFSLSATGSNLSYQWKKDGVDVGTNAHELTINNVTMNDVGIYTCVITGNCGEVTSDMCMMGVNTIPDASIDSTDPLCTQDSPVDLTATPTGGTWSGNGVSGNSFSPEIAGIGHHQIYYEVVNGVCSDTDSIIILVGSQPVIDTNIVNASSSGASDGSAIASANGGVEPYSYLWSNGDNDSIMDNIPAGTYSLTVTDYAECETIMDSIVIDFPDVISDNNTGILIYPNPADNEIFINTGNMHTGNIKMLNVLGQIIIQKPFNTNSFRLDISDINSGMYFIRIYNEEVEYLRKIKIH